MKFNKGVKMNRETWWLDVDERFYLELKQKKVVSIEKLNDLTTLLPLYPRHENAFKSSIQSIGDALYENNEWWENTGRETRVCPRWMWNLLSIKRGDLIVAVQTRTTPITTIGICEMPVDGLTSYKYDRDSERPQTIGNGSVNWINWDKSLFDFAPKSPGTVDGIQKLTSQHSEIVELWERHFGHGL